MSVTIRLMNIEDISDVHDLDQIAFTLPWPENSYHYELTQNQSSWLWVAEDKISDYKSRIVGMICVWIIVDEVHIATIAVHPDTRHAGIGKKLVANALLTAHNLGAQSAYLEVRESNSIAQNMYKKFGFEIVGKRNGYYSDNHEDALMMNLERIDPQIIAHYV